MSLKVDVYKGVFWSIIDKGGARGANFIIGILIARILTPADYGLIGMTMVFISISNLFIDSGISQALIQKKNRSAIDFSTAFIFNITIALACYIIIFMFAPLISRFYQEPILVPMLRVLGVSLIISSLSTVQKARLLVRLDFRKQAIANISGVIIGGATGLIWAYYHQDVWAIVYHQVTCQLTITGTYWILNKWHPSFEFSIASLKKLWNYGVKLLTAGILSTLLREINSLVIGKVYRPTELGYYSRAVQTSDMFAYTLNDIINAVTFPVLSKLQDDRDKFIFVYMKMLGMTAFCIFPILTMLSALAKPLFIWLLTEKWILAVPLFQWLCIARMLTPLTALNMNILNAKGRPGIVLKLELIKIPIIAAGLGIALSISVYALVITNLITTTICYFINAYSLKKYCNISIKSQTQRIYKVIILCGTIYPLCSCITHLNISSIFIFSMGLIIGTIVYASGAYLLKIEALYDIINVIKEKMNK